MQFSTIVSAFATLAMVANASPAAAPEPAAILAKRNGCFMTGYKYSQITDTDKLRDVRSRACDEFKGKYKAGQKWTHCMTIGGNRINFEVTRKKGSGGTLSKDLCVAAYTIEMNACSRGSKQWHQDYFFRADPNKGGC